MYGEIKPFCKYVCGHTENHHMLNDNLLSLGMMLFLDQKTRGLSFANVECFTEETMTAPEQLPVPGLVLFMDILVFQKSITR